MLAFEPLVLHLRMLYRYAMDDNIRLSLQSPMSITEEMRIMDLISHRNIHPQWIVILTYSHWQDVVNLRNK